MLGPFFDGFCFVRHLKKLEESFNNKAPTNTKEKLFAVFIMFNVNCYISSVQLFPEVPKGAFLPTRIFVKPFE
jgi:hypothetical protein